MADKFSKIVADFSTSLATKVAVGGNSATLQSATDDDGVALPVGQYCFTVDGNSSQKEYWLCDVNGTAVTNIQNITRQGTIAANSVREHRIGASVKITNFAHLLWINNVLDGTDENENTVKFTDTTHSGDIAFTGVDHPGLQPIRLTTVQRLALAPATTAIVYDTTAGEYYLWQGGAWVVISSGSVQANGSETVAGKFELSTVAQQGTATSAGETGSRLVPANSNLVKASSGAGDENKIAILGAGGKFVDGFMGAATTGASVVVKSTAGGKVDESLQQMTNAQSAILIGGAASDASSLHSHTPTGKIGFNLSDVTVANTAVETTLATISIPGGTLSTGNAIKIEIPISDLDIEVNPDPTLTIKLKYGGTTIGTATITNNDTGSAAMARTNMSGKIEGYVFANAATNVQEGSVSVFAIGKTQISLVIQAGASVGVGTAAIDSTADQTLLVTATWDQASAANSITIPHFIVTKIA